MLKFRRAKSEKPGQWPGFPPVQAYDFPSRTRESKCVTLASRAWQFSGGLKACRNKCAALPKSHKAGGDGDRLQCPFSQRARRLGSMRRGSAVMIRPAMMATGPSSPWWIRETSTLAGAKGAIVVSVAPIFGFLPGGIRPQAGARCLSFPCFLGRLLACSFVRWFWFDAHCLRTTRAAGSADGN